MQQGRYGVSARVADREPHDLWWWAGDDCPLSEVVILRDGHQIVDFHIIQKPRIGTAAGPNEFDVAALRKLRRE
jgi:hypothetical protein